MPFGTSENLTNAHGDSLMGWWPTNDRAGVLGSALSDDHAYAYSCMAFGNVRRTTSTPAPARSVVRGA